MSTKKPNEVQPPTLAETLLAATVLDNLSKRRKPTPQPTPLPAAAVAAMEELVEIVFALSFLADLGRFDTAYDDTAQNAARLFHLFGRKLDLIYVALSDAFHADGEDAT